MAAMKCMALVIVLLWILASAQQVAADKSYFLRMTIEGNHDASENQAINISVTEKLISVLEIDQGVHWILGSSDVEVEGFENSEDLVVIVKVDYEKEGGYAFLSKNLFKHFISTTDILAWENSNNQTTEASILSVYYYDSLEDAYNNTNALYIQMCTQSYFGGGTPLCPSQRCIDTTGSPVCQEICDYGEYLHLNQCVACGSGKTTLMRGATSEEYYCIDNCSAGQYYSLETESCQPCPSGQYKTEDDHVCHVCNYTSFNSTSCESTTERVITNRPVDIDLDLTIRLTLGLQEYWTSLYTNATYTNDEILNGVVSFFFYFYQYWTTVPSILTDWGSLPTYIGLCSPYYYDCRNVRSTLYGEELFTPVPGCVDPDTCLQFEMKVHVTVYGTREYVQREVNGQNVGNVSAVEAVMQLLYNPLPTTLFIPRFSSSPYQVVLPFSPTVSVIDQIEDRFAYVRMLVDDPTFLPHQTFPKVPEFIYQLIINESSVGPGQVLVSSKVGFTTSVTTSLLEKMTEYLLMLHENIPGPKESDTEIRISGDILWYKTQEDQDAGVSAVNTCEVLKRLQLDDVYCNGNSSCVDNNGVVECVPKEHECGNWTWGENCNQTCYCDLNNSASCNASDGSCICKEGFQGYQCDGDVDECQELWPCGANSYCDNTYGSYRCQCEAGYKKADNESTSCTEECGNWRWGKDCNQTCSCDLNNSASCNTSDGSCICKEGFQGYQCDGDVDECQELWPCGANSYCDNTYGSFRCQCEAGYKKADNEATSCTEECGNWRWGKDCNQTCSCDLNNSASCNTSDGSCICKEGFQGYQCDGDVDECQELWPCGANSYCDNTYGSFRCQCEAGYKKADNETTSCTEGCDPWMWGENCNQNCDCFVSGTESCSSINGSCVCRPGFESRNCSVDINECERTVFPCGPDQDCVNTEGSFQCVDSTCGQWKWGKDCNQTCVCARNNSVSCNTSDGSCICKEGFQGYQCDGDVDECQELWPCGANSYCDNTYGSFRCQCEAGYKKADNETTSCTEECGNWRWGKDCNQTCSCDLNNSASCNTSDGSCICKEGFQGYQCDGDVDECQELWPCGANSYCDNTYGSYRCQCEAGYKKADNETTSCTEECGNWRWGKDCNQTCSCDLNNSASCNTSDGSCICKEGFQGYQCDGDVDECQELWPCGANSYCDNTYGSFRCQCEAGYKKADNETTSCTEGCDPWMWGENCNQNCDCFVSGTESCSSINGSCVCRPGFESRNCSVDINECERTVFPCGPDQDCVNTEGSFQCVDSTCGQWKWGKDCNQTCVCARNNSVSCNTSDGSCICKEGFQGYQCDGDVDECQELWPCGANSYCENTYGSYRCQCEAGYKKADNESTSCTEGCDPWMWGENCNQNCDCFVSGTESCSSINGSCVCRPGFESRNCSVDINECERTVFPCGPDQDCVNTEGSFQCVDSTCGQWKWGKDCNQTCVCDRNNSASCNTSDGSCICKEGFQGYQCDGDVDECQELWPCGANSYCENTYGSYSCQCEAGYKKADIEATSCFENEPQAEDDIERQQRELYPYGTNAGDQKINRRSQSDTDYWWYWYDGISEPIYFATGVPFGSDKVTVAHVLSNGVITFGREKYVWWPNFEYIFNSRESVNVLAPFWFYSSPSQSGTVYYHLYEEEGSEGNEVFQDSPQLTEVLFRASNEVNEQFGLGDFQATTVLVATWERVEPYSWYTWLCSYYEMYKDEEWWKDYYQQEYEEHCFNTVTETNTFQAIFVSDGETSFAIVMYKEGEMKWVYEEWRTIAVGFVSSDTMRDYDVTYTNLTTQMDSIVWNTDRYGTWMEQVGKMVNPDSRCMKFFVKNKYLINNASHQALVDDLFNCPCSLERMGRQWWSLSWTEEIGRNRTYIVCYALSPMAKRRLNRLQGNPLNKLCCYRYTYPSYNMYSWEAWQEAWRSAEYLQYSDPNAGHLLLNEPWWWWDGDVRKSKEEDFLPHKWCCIDSYTPSIFCQLFNIVRPDYGCSVDVEFISGLALGDPHILTLDGLQYTLNGLGEYILMSVSEEDFMLQARTRQAFTSQGKKTNATVFVAFAAKEGSSSRFQVELDSQETGMVIMANDVDITLDFYNSSDYSETQGDNDITMIREDRDERKTVIAVFPSGISVEVYVGIKNLEFSVEVPTELKGKTKGLLGNFNGDPDDDFVLPDDTILPADETDTERKIFENFGKEWEVTTSSTVFTYPEGESALDYQFPDFEPIFLEEVESSKLAQAQSKCGQNDACIFDFIATEDENFAISTKNTEEEAESVKTNQGNNLPSLSISSGQLNQKNQLEVIHGQQTSLTFSATDSDASDSLTFVLRDNHGSGVSIDENTGVLTYLPDAGARVNIGVQVKDSKGGRSPIVNIDVAVCTDCNGRGSCDKTKTVKGTTGRRFVVFACKCWPAYTGDNCEDELDACIGNPCVDGQSCTDKTAAEQGNDTAGFICGPCPDGYKEQTSFCIDVNECIDNGTSPACPEHSTCENSVGSYSCMCNMGYRMENSKCEDIDECAEKTHACQQNCENTDGSYLCSCLSGNTLNNDKRTCTQDPTNAALCNAKGCSQTCTVENGVVSCSCNTGYKLDGDTQCVDVNECVSSNKPCSQICQNTDGGFTCSCYSGYKLAEDSVSCTKCNAPNYGKDCAKQCVCNGHGSCHHVRGCECDQGWKGLTCNKDIDECVTEQPCSSGQLCNNLKGSYECVCAAGYTMKNGVCEDVDECQDVLDHNCSLSVEDCVNTQGSYSCVCRKGLARDANNMCVDIDECVKQTHNCEQVCENTQGRYNCKCKYGYKLDTDRAHCVKRETDVCAGVTSLQCQHNCSVDLETNTPYCFCLSGFALVGTESCEDIDECAFDHLNLCDYKEGCVNTVGGYKCSCQPGFFLDNDGRSCVACSGGKWGQECANECACSTNAEKCSPQTGCVCKSGFTGTHCEKDIDECKTGVLTCPTGAECVNTQGGASCRCAAGYQSVSGSCQDIDECQSSATNTCEQECENFAGSFRCVCYPGYSYNAINDTCEDIDECTHQTHGCDQGCVNSEGGYRCTCQDGLKLDIDGVSCVVSSTCTAKTCEDRCAVVSGQETCFCPRGKEVDPADDSKCKDVDLCASSPCTDGCVETPGGEDFSCTCPKGKKLAADGFSCEDCLEGTYGQDCQETCDCNTVSTQSCNKIDGTCLCKSGWVSSTCSQDEDECTSGSTPCPTNSDCVNTPGSYVCKCNLGYYTDQNQCTACVANTYGQECSKQCDCDTAHSTCDRVSGSCVCQPGWEGQRCDTDINECQNNSPCVASKTNWGCINTPGSFKCGCDKGYEEDTSGNCVDIDECASEVTNQCSQACTNTPGSYSCSCGLDYQLSSDGHSCTDIDECSVNPSGCEQECTNTDGSFTCSCRDGYAVSDMDDTKCFEASGFGYQITLSMDVTGKNLHEKQSKDYKDLERKIEISLMVEIGKMVIGLKKIIIVNMRHGSVIVDFTSVIDKIENPSAASKMVEAILLMTQNGVNVNGTVQDATVTVGSVSVPPTSDKCVILEAIEECGSGEKCQLNDNGEAECKSSDDETDLTLIIGLGVGIPLVIALIVAIGAAVWYKKKYKEQRRVNVRQDQYKGDDKSSNPGKKPYFGVGPSDTRSVSVTSVKPSETDQDKLVP